MQNESRSSNKSITAMLNICKDQNLCSDPRFLNMILEIAAYYKNAKYIISYHINIVVGFIALLKAHTKKYKS